MGNKAFRNATQDLRSAQNAELWAMKQMGADKAAIQAERLANRTERQDFKAAGTVPAAPVTSQLNYGGPLVERISGLMGQAADVRTQYNLPGKSGSSDGVQKGFGTKALVQALYNKEQGTLKPRDPLGQMLQRAEQNWGKSLTAAEIAKNGVLSTIKPVKGQDGMVRVNRGFSVGNNDKAKISDIYRQNADGTYTLAGFDKTHQNIENKKSGLGSVIAALAGTALFGAPLLGLPGAVTTGSAVADAAASSAIGAAGKG